METEFFFPFKACIVGPKRNALIFNSMWVEIWSQRFDSKTIERLILDKYVSLLPAVNLFDPSKTEYREELEEISDNGSFANAFP